MQVQEEAAFSVVVSKYVQFFNQEEHEEKQIIRFFTGTFLEKR